MLRRDSKDRIKIFNRDEWLLKRQREKTMKLLGLDTDLKNEREKSGCDEINNKIQIRNNLSDGISSLTLSKNSFTDKKTGSDIVDTSNCDTPKHGPPNGNEQKSRCESLEPTLVNSE